MKIAVYPGSFDPVTNGHLDIIRRAARIFDTVIVTVFTNNSKKCAFSIDQRMDMLRLATRDIANVQVDSSDRLLVHYMQEKAVKVIIKGVRRISDFEYEFQMALANHQQDKEIETLFMMTASEYSHLSSSLVRELAAYGGNLTDLVPDEVIPLVYDKLRRN